MMGRPPREIRSGKLKCSVCLKWKPPIEFNNDNRSTSGYQTKCKKCCKLWHKKYYKKYKIQINKRASLWGKANRDKVNKRQRKYRSETNYDAMWRKQNSDKCKNAQYKHRYGLTLDEFKKLVKKQKSKCALCGKKRKLIVDHCHATNQIRGLICNSCNIGLGQLGDTLAGLQKAIKYLLGKKNA